MLGLLKTSPSPPVNVIMYVPILFAYSVLDMRSDYEALPLKHVPARDDEDRKPLIGFVLLLWSVIVAAILTQTGPDAEWRQINMMCTGIVHYFDCSQSDTGDSKTEKVNI